MMLTPPLYSAPHTMTRVTRIRLSSSLCPLLGLVLDPWCGGRLFSLSLPLWVWFLNLIRCLLRSVWHWPVLLGLVWCVLCWWFYEHIYIYMFSLSVYGCVLFPSHIAVMNIVLIRVPVMSSVTLLLFIVSQFTVIILLLSLLNL